MNSLALLAITFELVGPCSQAPVLQTSYPLSQGPESVGKATLEILDLNHVPHQGYESGMSSILNTPTGDDSLEVISNSEMRAYGWCYEVNGAQPAVMPDKAILKGGEHVRWFYAFSHYVAGKWVSVCEPAYTVQPAALCRH